MSEWQPIETIPKDGSLIIVGYGRQSGFPVKIIHYDKLHKVWLHDGYSCFGIENNVTYWMPLPEPPKGE